MRARNPERLRAKREKLEVALKELIERERQQDDERALIIGRAVMTAADQDAAFREQLTALLERAVSTPRGRKLLGLSAIQRRVCPKATEPISVDTV